MRGALNNGGGLTAGQAHRCVSKDDELGGDDARPAAGTAGRQLFRREQLLLTMLGANGSHRLAVEPTDRVECDNSHLQQYHTERQEQWDQ